MTSRKLVQYADTKEVHSFSGQYLCNHSTLDIGVLGYIGIVWPKNTLPKSGPFLLLHPVYAQLLYIYVYIYIYIYIYIYWSSWIPTQAHCNLIGGNMILPLPALSPISILRPSLSHCTAFIPAKEKEGARLRSVNISIFLLFWNFVIGVDFIRKILQLPSYKGSHPISTWTL